MIWCWSCIAKSWVKVCLWQIWNRRCIIHIVGNCGWRSWVVCRNVVVTWILRPTPFTFLLIYVRGAYGKITFSVERWECLWNCCSQILRLIWTTKRIVLQVRTRIIFWCPITGIRIRSNRWRWKAIVLFKNIPTFDLVVKWLLPIFFLFTKTKVVKSAFLFLLIILFFSLFTWCRLDRLDHVDIFEVVIILWTFRTTFFLKLLVRLYSHWAIARLNIVTLAYFSKRTQIHQTFTFLFLNLNKINLHQIFWLTQSGISYVMLRWRER